ncbi:HepA Superfamily II DNA/RNA helicases, SNF2 family [uncultured Caudovirales phage]|uniref:HepA Superfamily II DNA/RNA helicases, SNF2 family n=1 Tax=uncultured Caudovirales phage TaxID=2100421 RepID=A0A6J5PC74_9CAUD|nr:HepA Superfamily II DNA/RNA helicases, SNF2 family [uncultured Caudovirales phage]
MNNQIKVSFDTKTRRLKMLVPFYLNDALRNFPSKRFDAKSKTWRVPLTKANINYINQSRHILNYAFDEESLDAIANFERLVQGPVYIDFPYHLYDFTKSSTGFTPMVHQRKMLDRTWNLPAAAWFAKMGVGKTFAAVHLACARYLAGLIDAVVIVCPSTLRPTWRKELAKYSTVDYDFKIHETKASWLKEFYAEKRSGKLQILAVSVEGLGVSEALYDSVCGFFVGRRVMVICDESSRIKNPSAQRTKRMIEFRDASVYRVILNGTPIAVGMEDLWSQYEFLDSNIIGSGDYWSFKTRYVEMGGYEGKQVVGYKNTEELMRLIEPYTVEVGKDVLDLPPKVHKIRYVQATPEQKALLKLIKKGFDDNPNSPLTKVENTLERVLRWRQVVGGWLPRQDPLTEKTTLEPLKSNPKMDSFLELIDDHYVGSKFIIWSTFVHELEYIQAALASKYGDASVALYYGATDKEDRSRIEDRYCNDPTLRFFVGNPATAGLGLTLISGMEDIMVYYSGTNAYIDRAQSEDRSHRIGQQRSVTVVDMVMEKTVDEAIIDSIGEKMNVEEYIMTRLKEGKQMDFEG